LPGGGFPGFLPGGEMEGKRLTKFLVQSNFFKGEEDL